MIRRHVSCAAPQRVASLISSSSSSYLMMTPRFNASSSSTTTNSNPNETEAEREARMRQEMMNRMMGGRNPFANMFGQTQTGQQAAGAGAGAGGNGQNTVPPLRGYDTTNYNHWANSAFHKSLRFWSSVLIFFTGIYMMRRMGIMGDYSHLTLPFYAASPADQTKWILFIFNIQDSRRRQLVKEFEAKKLQFPNMNFFDYVDTQEQFWRSSPNFSSEQVIAAVGGAMRTQGPPRAITSIKATLNTSNFFTSTIFGGTGNPAEERAKRIDGMMTTLGTALNPMASLMGGLTQQPLPPQLQQYMQQQQPQQQQTLQVQPQLQQQQQVPPQLQQHQQYYSGGGLTAITTGAVPYDRQQQYGGMNFAPSQLQQQGYNNQQQQQQQLAGLSYAQRPDNHSFYGTGSQGVVSNLNQWTSANQQPVQSTPPSSAASTITPTDPATVTLGKESHQCEVKFLNEDVNNSSNSSNSNNDQQYQQQQQQDQLRPVSAPAGAPEIADQQ